MNISWIYLIDLCPGYLLLQNSKICIAISFLFSGHGQYTKEGTYIFCAGPSYESPAELKFFKLVSVKINRLFQYYNSNKCMDKSIQVHASHNAGL